MHAMRFKQGIKITANHAWFHPHPALFKIQLQHPRQVFGDVQNDNFAHGLAGQAGAAAPSQQG